MSAGQSPDVDRSRAWRTRLSAAVEPVKSSRAFALADWSRRKYAMPAPPRVKRRVMERYGRADDTWIETGTYLGSTTAYLAREATHVYSIEPEPALARRAREKFANVAAVTIVEGLSEDCLADVLDDVEGPVSFWLDGHFSAGVTHQGPVETPIGDELAIIAKHLDRLGTVTVLVDDVRLFDPAVGEGYPARTSLVHWAEANAMWWTIEHDIFVATTPD